MNIETIYQKLGYTDDENILSSVYPAKAKEIFQFSRKLIATDSFETILEHIAKSAIQILDIDFCIIYSYDSSDSYSCQGYESRLDGSIKHLMVHAHTLINIPDPILLTLHKQSAPIHISEKNAKQNPRLSVFMEQVKARNLYFGPMNVNHEHIGFLLLGKNTEETSDISFHRNISLISLISNLAASALHRAKLSNLLNSTQIETVLALAKTIDARDAYTGGHSKRMVNLAEKIAQKLNMSESEIMSVRMGAILHDIGKIGVPDQILNKPGPLTDDEWDIMKKHPDIGADIILSVSKLAYVAPLVRFHHERFDGSGYPYGLKGDLIPIGSRIIAVVDSYSAICDGRVYKPPRCHKDAISEIQRCAGTDFDPQIVNAFLKVFDDNPDSYYDL